jgi:hypothetical protein
MSRRLRVLLGGSAIGVVLAAALLALTVAGATGEEQSEPAQGQSAAPPSAESLPCTKANEATNFEVFSAGPSPTGLPLTAALRRCDVYTGGANYVSYIYGDCEYRNPVNSDGGCEPPLEIQTWPACQRSLAEYTYEGKPYPHTDLARDGDAEVAEFEDGSRVEVYTGSATIVVFSTDPSVAKKVLPLLRPQQEGASPAARSSELDTKAPQGLPAPAPSATEGDLTCAS